MKLRVKYSAQLRTALQRAEEFVELPDGSRLDEALVLLAGRDQSGRPHLIDERGRPRAGLIIVVNDAAVSSHEVSTLSLQDGDVLTLLPPIAGG